MKNGLYIVSTPIGNLGDISSRAVKTLGESDIIICENPKHSLKLLSKLDIKKKLISLHDYNEEIIKLSKRENNIIIIAFFLQLIIFCIIQYFEINSIQEARKKNAKRKIK